MSDYSLQNNIKIRRLAFGLSQSDLAERCDVTRQTIAAIEKGNYSPSVLLALKIASTLDININELFSLKEEL